MWKYPLTCFQVGSCPVHLGIILTVSIEYWTKGLIPIFLLEQTCAWQRSNPAEERTSRIHEPAQMEIAGPIDEHFNDALEDGGDFSSFPARAKGKVMYSLYI